ncbi:MAG: hypothetical protein JST68_28010 [Bacteroidetes bacterium]|nr:hypothetical protein [Bacteroidota bacterium]
MRLVFTLLCCISMSAFGQSSDVIDTGKRTPTGVTVRIICQNSIADTKDPFFIINGKPYIGNALSTLDPKKVLSLQILKDSDAIAIYGSRGVNGVILIRTTDTLSTKQNAYIYVPGAIDSIFKGGSFWRYSITRIGTAHDSLHFYSIQLDITRHDSTGKIKPFEKLRAPGSVIFCRFHENGTTRKIPFIWQGSQWYSDFIIHSNHPLPIEIVTYYRNKKKIMHAVLNKGTYPGENDK